MSEPSAVAAPWLTVVGCLPDGTLAPHAPAGSLSADAVFGAARLLDATNVPAEARRPWPRPFADGIRALLARRPRPTTVLASGDPLHHGVGGTLLRHLSAEEFSVYPAPSAFSLAAAALRWPLDSVHCVSLHDRPAEDVTVHLRPGRRLLVLTRDGEAPAAIAAAATGAGFGQSVVTVLERLPDGPRTRERAAALCGTFDPLNVVAIEAPHRAPVTAAALVSDGCVTKDEVRAVTVAALGGGGGHLWDVGAGSGAVAIDWCRAGGTATLFERVAARAAMARTNLATAHEAAAVVEGEALAGLAEAREPDAIFLGGGVSDDALFAALWARLPAGGRLVANAVTLEGEAALAARQRRLGGALTRIAISHAAPLGQFTAMRPQIAVAQWAVTKE